MGKNDGTGSIPKKVIFKNIKSVIAPKHQDFLDTPLFYDGLPLLIGGMLGVVLALLIVQERWFFAVVVVFLVPVAILFNRYPFIAFMIWFLVMPFLPIGGISSYVWWVIHRTLIPLALIIVILSRMLKLKEYPLVRLGLPELSMVVYLGIMVVLILLNFSSPLLSLYELYDRCFVPFAAYWLMRFIQPGEKDLKRFAPIMLVMYVVEIILGFWARNAPNTLPALWTFERMGERMSGSFSNPNIYAYLLLLLMSLLFHFTMNQPNKHGRRYFIPLFAVGIVCIFLTSTRACWLAGAIVLLGLLVIYPKPILSMLLVFIPTVIMPSLVVFAAEFAFATERLNTEGTVDSRIVQMRAAENMFYARPLAGWGFNTYDRYDWKFMTATQDNAPTRWDVHYGTSHHTYLTILAETGILGFFFQFFPLVWWSIFTIKALPRLPRHGFWSWRLLVTLWLPLIAYLIVAQFIDMRFFWFAIGSWWWLLGLVANVVQSAFYPDPDKIKSARYPQGAAL